MERNEIKNEISKLKLDCSSLVEKNKIVLLYTQKIIEKLEEITTENNEEVAVKSFHELLSANWNLINGSLLSYTALPKHPLTKFLCYLSKYLAVYYNDSEWPAIRFLMPTVCYESYDAKYPDLNEVDLHKVLETHVMSHYRGPSSQDFLIPIALLTHHELIDFKEIKDIYNPYFDHQKHLESQASFSESELSRLYKHSELTKNIGDTIDEYFSSIFPSLLNKLQKLHTTLKDNSVIGSGKEDKAGELAYAGIVEFMTFWDKLEENFIQSIPTIKQEIELIKDLASDKTKNNDILSCFDIRQRKLQEVIRGNEEKLIKITINEEIDLKNHKKVEELILRFKQKITVLNRQLKEDTYFGCDALEAITQNISKEMCIVPGLKDIHELINYLSKLSNEKINLFCTINSVEILRVIKVEDLHFLAKLPGESFGPLLNTVDITKLIKTNEHLKSCLEWFSLTQREIVCEALGEGLSSIIKTRSGYEGVSQYLPSKQRAVIECKFLLESFQTYYSSQELKTYDLSINIALKKELINVVHKLENNPTELEPIFKKLTADQLDFIFTDIKETLLSILRKGYALKSIFRYLNTWLSSALVDTLKEEWPVIIKNCNCLKETLLFLDSAQQMMLLQSIKDCWLLIIKSSADFKGVFECLKGTKSRAIVFDACIDIILSKIKNISDFIEVFKNLNSEQRTTLLQNFIKEENWSLIIKNSGDFNSVFECLKEANSRAIMFGAYKEKLQYIIHSGADLKNIFEYLTNEQREFIFNLVKETLASKIENIFHFSDAFMYLTSEQRMMLLQSFDKERWKLIIKSSAAFKKALACFTEDNQRAVVFNTCIDIIPSKIENIFHFSDAFMYLTSEQRMMLLQSFDKERWKLVIKSSADFKKALACFTEDNQRAVIFDACIDIIPLKIENIFHFSDAFIYLTSEQRMMLLQSFDKERWKLVIKSSADFKKALACFTEDNQRAVIFDACIDIIPLKIENIFHFSDAFIYLTSEQRRMLLQSFDKERWKLVIKSSADFKKALACFTEDNQRAVIFDACIDIIPLKIENIFHFSDAFIYLTSEQRRMLLQSFDKERWKLVIKSSADFKKALACFTEDNQRAVIFDACIDIILLKIENIFHFSDAFIYLTSEQRMMLLQNFDKERWKLIIKSSADFKKVIECLTKSNLCSIMLDSSKEQLLSIIYTADFKIFIDYLPVEEFSFVCKVLKEEQSQDTQVSYLAVLFNDLAEDRLQEVCKFFNNKLFSILSNINVSLINIFKDLTDARLRIICEIFKDLHSILPIFDYLTKNQLNIVLGIFKEEFLSILKDDSNLISILMDQNPKTCSIVCEFFYDECRKLIKNSYNLSVCLNADKYRIVYQTLKLENLPNFNVEEGSLMHALFPDHIAINANEDDDEYERDEYERDDEEDLQKLNNIDKENLYLLSKLGDPELKDIVENNRIVLTNGEIKKFKIEDLFCLFILPVNELKKAFCVDGYSSQKEILSYLSQRNLEACLHELNLKDAFHSDKNQIKYFFSVLATYFDLKSPDNFLKKIIKYHNNLKSREEQTKSESFSFFNRPGPSKTKIDQNEVEMFEKKNNAHFFFTLDKEENIIMNSKPLEPNLVLGKRNQDGTRKF